MDLHPELQQLHPSSAGALSHLTVSVLVSAASKKAGEPLIISDITKGSVAHRSELLHFLHYRKVIILSFSTWVHFSGICTLLKYLFLFLTIFDLDTLQLYTSMCTFYHCFHGKIHTSYLLPQSLSVWLFSSTAALGSNVHTFSVPTKKNI